MIALITPTGGRANQINLCLHFMQRQTYSGKVVWIIVDDCDPRTIEWIQINRENWNVIKVYPATPWREGQNTQGRNIAEGINALLTSYKQSEIEGIFIIEDDDYYKPIYLERMVPRLPGFQAAGEIYTIYYNVFYRTHFTNPNTGHSSLFQTAFTIGVLPIFESCLSERFIDATFWMRLSQRNLFYDGNLSVGMKGMPGRYGIGAGHSKLRNMPRDNDWSYLVSIIGMEDVRLYTKYYGGSGVQQYTLFNKRGF